MKNAMFILGFLLVVGSVLGAAAGFVAGVIIILAIVVAFAIIIGGPIYCLRERARVRKMYQR